MTLSALCSFSTLVMFMCFEVVFLAVFCSYFGRYGGDWLLSVIPLNYEDDDDNDN